MRHSLALLVLIMLTSLDGNSVWVESSQVQVIRTRSSECGAGTGAVIRVGATALCVKESADEVREKIQRANE